jgi:putative component of toxin-antitoxin plasmid stabilization module
MSVGGSLFDRYEKKKIEERLDQLEKEENEDAKPILQH